MFGLGSPKGVRSKVGDFSLSLSLKVNGGEAGSRGEALLVFRISCEANSGDQGVSVEADVIAASVWVWMGKVRSKKTELGATWTL